MKELIKIPTKIGSQFIAIHQYGGKIWSKTLKVVAVDKYVQYNAVTDNFEEFNVQEFEGSEKFYK